MAAPAPVALSTVQSMTLVPGAGPDLAAGGQGAGHTPPRARSRAREVLSGIGTGLSAGLLLLVLGLAVLVIGVPAAVGGMPYTILTGSMAPGLPPGTLVVVKPADPAEIRIGDVVTYQLESGHPAVVTHRVVERIIDTRSGDLLFVTKGDANDTADAVPVMPVQLKGTVWYSIPWLGWVNQAVTGELRGWLIPLVAVLLFGYALWMVITGLRDRRRDLRRNQRVTQHP